MFADFIEFTTGNQIVSVNRTNILHVCLRNDWGIPARTRANRPHDGFYLDEQGHPNIPPAPPPTPEAEATPPPFTTLELRSIADSCHDDWWRFTFPDEASARRAYELVRNGEGRAATTQA